MPGGIRQLDRGSMGFTLRKALNQRNQPFDAGLGNVVLWHRLTTLATLLYSSKTILIWSYIATWNGSLNFIPRLNASSTIFQKQCKMESLREPDCSNSTVRS